jgi:plasmid stabilization system protein ParE
VPDAYRIIFSERVAKDLDGISRWIAKDSPTNALHFVEKILAAVESLKTFPNRNVVDGQDRRTLQPVRSLPVGSHIIFFKVFEEQLSVHILQVRHGAMRRPRRFK